MRLSRVCIRRYKSIGEIQLTIPARDPLRQGSADFVSILGENNVGKSSILEAIRLACQTGPAIRPTIDQFPKLTQARGPIEVELEFDGITEKDRLERAIGEYIFTENGVAKFRVKKTWKAAGAAPECLVSSSGESKWAFASWPEPKAKRDLEALGPDWCALVAAAEKKKKIAKPAKDFFLQMAIEIESPLIKKLSPELWTNAATSVDGMIPDVVYVPALRETNQEADVSEKHSVIRKIVKALFDEQLSRHDKVISFKRAAAELEELFAKGGKHKIVSHVESKITAKLDELIGLGVDLRFSAPDVTSDLASKTEFRVLDGEVSTKPEHQGHGAQRSIVLALLQMYAEQLRERKNTDDVTTLFLIEEPEIYMHPEMCRRMRDALLRIAQSGIGQIICTTHSPVFLDLADRHDGIVMVKREGEFPAIIQRVDDVFDQTEGDRVQRARLRMTLNFDPMVNEVFFANRVCLVEGDCEIAAIDAIARKLDEQGQVHWPTYLAARRSIAVINCKGKSTIPAFQKVLNAFSIKYCVVHDEDEDPGPLRVNKTIEALLLSTSERLVHAPNFEKSIFNDSWKKDKPWRATVAIKSAATIDSRLIAFFEFILGKSIDQLRQSSLSKSAEEPFFAPVSRLPKRNLRSDLRRINVPEQAYQRADELGQVFRIAAGPSFMPATGETGRLHKIDGSPVSVFAVVAGDSMTDTLIPGDILALEVLDDVNIYPVTDERGKMTAGEIRKIIDDNAIYVLAKDDEYAHRSYTIKRIRVSELANGGWHGEICADNPETSWGDRGQVAIRKGDRVHFAAKVVGLVSRVAESPLESQTDSIPGDKP